MRRAPVEERGWSAVRLTAAGKSDPLFAGIASPLRVFQWQRQTFTLPPGAERLSVVALNPVKSRGEPLGVTRLRRAGGQRGFAVIEEGVCFQLPAADLIRWGLEGLRPQGPEGAPPTA